MFISTLQTAHCHKKNIRSFQPPNTETCGYGPKLVDQVTTGIGNLPSKPWLWGHYEIFSHRDMENKNRKYWACITSNNFPETSPSIRFWPRAKKPHHSDCFQHVAPTLSTSSDRSSLRYNQCNQQQADLENWDRRHRWSRPGNHILRAAPRYPQVPGETRIQQQSKDGPRSVILKF